MTVVAPDNHTIGKRLVQAGVIPTNTVSVDIRIATNEVITITTKSFATPEQVEAIQQALLEGQNSKARTLARKLYINTPGGSREVEVSL